MTGLTDFLAARIAEDAADNDQLVRDEVARCRADGMPRITEADIRAYWGGQAWWIRCLAEVEAKRRILDEHGPETERTGWATEVTYCRVCRYDDGLDRDLYGCCPTVRLLALPYANHPDYHEEWRP